MRTGIAFAVALAAQFAPLRGQETPALRAGLGFATGSAGRIVTIPLALEGATGRDVARVASNLTFSSTQLTFVRIEQAGSPNDSAFEAVAHVRDAAPGAAAATSPPGDDRKQVLEIRVSSKRDGAPLADGIIGY